MGGAPAFTGKCGQRLALPRVMARDQRNDLGLSPHLPSHLGNGDSNSLSSLRLWAKEEGQKPVAQEQSLLVVVARPLASSVPSWTCLSVLINPRPILRLNCRYHILGVWGEERGTRCPAASRGEQLRSWEVGQVTSEGKTG